MRRRIISRVRRGREKDGDFHLGNMVIDKDRRLSVIDWDF